MTSVSGALEEFFLRAEQVFETAAGRSPGRADRFYRIGGFPVSLHFADPRMAEHLTSAFRHLAAAPEDAPALNVYAWDARSPDGLLPPPPWEALSFFERANLRGYRDERFTLIYDRGTDAFSAVDTYRQTAIYWTRDFENLPYYELAAPLRHLLQAWLQSRGIFVTHASAVGLPEGGALLAGRGGSGKSTTAVVCWRAGMQYAGDDFVLTAPDPVPAVHSLYSSAKLNASALAWLPELAPAVTNPGRLGPEKALVFLSTLVNERLAAGFPLKAILLPRAANRPGTRISPVAPEDAYKSIVPDTALRALGDVRLVFRAFSRLVYELPCYRLDLGTDLARIPDAVARVLAPLR